MKGQKKIRRCDSISGKGVNQKMIQTSYLTTQREKRKERRAWALMLAEAALVTAIVITILITLADTGLAEREGRQCWVMCRPDGVVNLRGEPKKHGKIFGGAQCGADMLTDGKERNGFLHVYALAAEQEEGWISSRYIVYDEPERVDSLATVRAEGRTACREWIGGKVIRWLQEGECVLVYLVSEEWAVTEYGYIRTELLEVAQG